MDCGQERIDYLRTIFHFIDYELETVSDGISLKQRLTERDKDKCTSVLIGPDYSSDEKKQLIDVVKEEATDIALLQL